MTGWRLVLPSAAVFLLPILVAIAGTSIGGPGRIGEFWGGLIGLSLGLLGAIVIGRMLQRSSKENA